MLKLNPSHNQIQKKDNNKMIKENIKDLITSIAEGDSVAIQDNFNAIMSAKIADQLDIMRASVASDMFRSSVVEESVELNETEATHKWYSVKHWGDDSHHFDNLDSHLQGHEAKHAATHSDSTHRPDHHIGIPVKAHKAIAYMNKHAKPLTEEVELDESNDVIRLKHTDHLGNVSHMEVGPGKDATIKDSKSGSSISPGGFVHNPSIKGSKEQTDAFRSAVKKAHKKGKHAVLKAVRDVTKDPRWELHEELSLKDFSIEELEDFMMSEDFEQLDELSKQTLGSYVKKAEHNKSMHGNAADDYIDRGDQHSDHGDKDAARSEYKKAYKHIEVYSKRQKGIAKASKRLNKEEVEELDEEELPTGIKIYHTDKHGNSGHHIVFSTKDADRLHKEVKKAGGTVTHHALMYGTREGEKHKLSEEFEQLDELSKQTLGSYVKKASEDAAGSAAYAMQTKGQGPGKPLEKSFKRLKGVAKAADKLTKEEFEELDEARRGTFRAGSKSYFKAGQAAIKSIKAAAKKRAEEEKSKVDSDKDSDLK